MKDELIDLKNSLNKLYLETLMNGKADSKNVILEINSGAGGVESQDWVAMLLECIQDGQSQMDLNVKY